MSEAVAQAGALEETAPKKGRVMPFLLGLAMALVGGAGGYFAGNSGLLSALDSGSSQQIKDAESDIAFVDVSPLVVSITRPDRIAQLRLQVALEVEKPYASQTEELMPRLKDVLYSYLRAVDTTDFDGPGALVQLRAQMLRRVQIVVGHDAVKDLLIQEFVVN